MVDDFKFFSKNDGTNYNGEMSLQVIRFFRDYIEGRLWGINKITTNIATYKIVETFYENGEISRGVVNAFPLEDITMNITFHINAGNVVPCITRHTIEIQ